MKPGIEVSDRIERTNQSDLVEVMIHIHFDDDDVENSLRDAYFRSMLNLLYHQGVYYHYWTYTFPKDHEATSTTRQQNKQAIDIFAQICTEEEARESILRRLNEPIRGVSGKHTVEDADRYLAHIRGEINLNTEYD